MATTYNRNPEFFLNLLKKSRQGKLKVYIGMSAGVGKTYRMLQEAHALLANDIDVRIGYVETHNRTETQALLYGLPVISRRKLFYKGKALEEMDIQAIINERPEVVIVDELAHSNIEGSRNEKRWQDVLALLATGINVITAVNIQHIESLNTQVRHITGIEVQERVPDSVLIRADEVVNIDLTADELIQRLKEGKVYQPSKIPAALGHFFKTEHILQLRELALKEVAAQVERKVESEIIPAGNSRREKLLACISSNEQTARAVIRKAARLANYYNATWYVLYVQLPREGSNSISLSKQRHLINNLKLATELGAEVLRLQGRSVARAIMLQCEQLKITTVCIGKPHLSLLKIILATDTFNTLLNKISGANIDLIILS